MKLEELLEQTEKLVSHIHEMDELICTMRGVNSEQQPDESNPCITDSLDKLDNRIESLCHRITMFRCSVQAMIVAQGAGITLGR